MNRRRMLAVLLVFSPLLGGTLLAGTGPVLAELRDGRSYDSGRAMTERSPGAPEALDEARFLLGQYDVSLTMFDGEGAAKTSACQAEIVYMNRGWAYQERLHCPDFEGSGQPLDAFGFVGYNAAGERWFLGEVDSLTEAVRVADGELEDGVLELENAVRRGGGLWLSRNRYRYRASEKGGLVMEGEKSADSGRSWKPWLVKRYSRRQPQAGLLAGSGVGAAAAGLPAEARQFDFLLGEWTSSHDLTTAGGQRLQWQANSTAVFALGGRAILEFNWFDVDPSLPDAATTILRIYNRSMRRWESLYLPNRSNAPLHFGGRWEGDRMVLHPFETDTGRPISRWVFHDIGKNRYRWYGATSSDRGETETRSWIIEAVRNDPASGVEGDAGATGDPAAGSGR